jgi:hypothetical protein
VIWGSVGHARRSAGRQLDDRPMWRGGFAAFYGPFGGSGDTTVVFEWDVTDSTDTTGLEGGNRRAIEGHRDSRGHASGVVHH